MPGTKAKQICLLLLTSKNTLITGEAGNAHYSAVTHLTGLPLDLGVKCMIAEYHVYAGCRRGIVNGQYRGGSGPTRAVMDQKFVKETFSRIEKTSITSDEAVQLVKKVLLSIGLQDNESTVRQEQEPIPVKQRSQLQVSKHLAEQIKARADARISSPKYINAPHKAPKKNLKGKIKFTDRLEDLSPTKNISKSKKTLDEKGLQTLKEGVSLKVLESGLYEITVKEDEKRCYKVDLRTEKANCTCLEFENIKKSKQKSRREQICKHILVVLLCLGFPYGSDIIRKHCYSVSDRIMIELKIAGFLHQNLNIEEIIRKFENEIKVKEPSEQEIALPFFNKKKTYGQYKSYEEAKLFVDKHTEKFPCKWYGVKYDELRYQCTCATHTTKGSGKLRQKLSQARPLVFLVYFTSIFKNINTGRFSAKDEKRYFHMLSECVTNLGGEKLINFSNLKPPFDIDITRIPKENRELVIKTFPEYNFVE